MTLNDARGVMLNTQCYYRGRPHDGHRTCLENNSGNLKSSVVNTRGLSGPSKDRIEEING